MPVFAERRGRRCGPGGTQSACADVGKKLGNQVVECIFLMEAEGLSGRKCLDPYPVSAF
jgi:hypothetical protein